MFTVQSIPGTDHIFTEDPGSRRRNVPCLSEIPYLPLHSPAPDGLFLFVCKLFEYAYDPIDNSHDQLQESHCQPSEKFYDLFHVTSYRGGLSSLGIP